MPLRKARWIGILAVVCGLDTLGAGALPILTVETQQAMAGEQEPAPALAKAVVSALDEDDVVSLRQCMKEHGLPPNAYERVFRGVALPRVSTPQPLTFVRPALEPFCAALDGGHLLRYWLVAEISDAPKYAIRHAGGGDTVEVLSSGTNGSFDLAETNCTTTSCLSRVLKFDGRRYRPVQCERQVYRNGKLASTQTVACEP